MAETVKFLRIRVVAEYAVDGDDGASLVSQDLYTADFENGTSSNQVGNVWVDKTRNLNATSEDIDVFNDIDDFQGQPAGFNNLKVLMLKNLDEDSGDNFVLSPGSGNPITTILGGTSPTLTVGPGGLLLLVNPIDGYAVTDGSADEIRLTTPDNSNCTLLLAGDNA